MDDSGATVALGETRVMAVVTAELEAPYPDRPNEGSIRFNVEFSPMASPTFQPGRPGRHPPRSDIASDAHETLDLQTLDPRP